MENEIIELETKWMNAWKNKDLAVVDEILSDDFTLTSSLSTGELVNKKMWMDKLKDFHCEDFRFEKINVRIYGTAAVVNSLFHQQATANGKDWSGNFLLTDVWIHKDNTWQVVARHASWLNSQVK